MTAALDGGPGTQEALEPDTFLVLPETDDGSRLWHFKHRWSTWGEVFSSHTAGIMGAFTGGSSGPWWQDRNCTKCKIVQRRRVELMEDRTYAKA